MLLHDAMTSRDHFEQTHYEVRKLGEGAYGDVYLAVDKAKAGEVCTTLRQTNATAIRKELRRNLVAVKFSRRATLHHTLTSKVIRNLTAEIRILTGDKAFQHPRVIRAISHYDQGAIQWLATLHIPGGDLDRFLATFDQSISISFVWHIGLQVAEALSFLMFGTADPKDTGRATPQWRIAHGDIHSGNIFLKPGDALHGLGNFPDIVLADFGETQRFPASARPRIENDFKHARDISDLGTVLYDLFNAVRRFSGFIDDRLLICWVGLLGNNSTGDDTTLLEREGVPYLRALSSDFMDTADDERRRHYQPLSAAAVEKIASSGVSDSELDMIVCRTTGQVRLS